MCNSSPVTTCDDGVGFLNPFDTTIFSRGLADIQLHNADIAALTGTLIGLLVVRKRENRML